MEKIKIIRHILGYTVGLSVFAIIIPMALISFSTGTNSVIHATIADNPTVRTMIAAPFLILGVFFAVWSNIALFRIGKGGPADGFNVALSPRTEKLVTSGPYRYSRNPMVLGAFSAYLSIGLFLNSVACMILLAVCFFLVILYLRLTEEKRLYKDFGEEFLEYKKKVPMIIPFTKRRKNR